MAVDTNLHICRMFCSRARSSKFIIIDMVAALSSIRRPSNMTFLFRCLYVLHFIVGASASCEWKNVESVNKIILAKIYIRSKPRKQQQQKWANDQIFSNWSFISHVLLLSTRCQTFRNWLGYVRTTRSREECAKIHQAMTPIRTLFIWQLTLSPCPIPFAKWK